MLDVIGFFAVVFRFPFDGRCTAVLCSRETEGWRVLIGEDVLVRWHVMGSDTGSETKTSGLRVNG